MDNILSTDKAILVGADFEDSLLDVESSLEELTLLADTAGIEVVGQATQRLVHPDPSTFIRSGKVEEIKFWIEELGANIVIFDDELSPRHQRELEKEFGEETRVIDRSALILDIFASHARSKEGRIQVELAQYEYRLPRLTRQWTHLARQAGGAAARGGSGGVGLRGPGETQLETDRREIKRKISYLKAELEKVRAHRGRQRAQRREAAIPIVSLVGYTNAGKSTLLNSLSGANVYSADQLFATLDPTTRRIELENGREILITDTVGFIQKLPPALFAAFQATLEGISEADLILHVVDISHPNVFEQIESVEQVLTADLRVDDRPWIVVFNKIDRIEGSGEELRSQLLERFPGAVCISAKTGEGLDDLLKTVDETLSENLMQIEITVPYSEGSLISQFYDHAVVQKEVHHEGTVTLTGLVPPALVYLFKAFTK